MTLELRPAQGGDHGEAEAILVASGLPTADLGTDAVQLFLAVAGSRTVGVGGLEVAGSVGLLRSVAVKAPERGNGFGRAICGRLEERARREEIDTLYLLTATAGGFFAGLGYEELARSAAPPSVRATTEFAELCPESAILMRKRI